VVVNTDTDVPYLQQPWPGKVDATSFESKVKHHAEQGFVIKVRSTGPCPRCQHTTSGDDWVYELDGFADADSDPEVEADLERELGERWQQGDLVQPERFRNRMVCACGKPHEGQPGPMAGCGASWDLLISAR
jgi:hypothetical protein